MKIRGIYNFKKSMIYGVFLILPFLAFSMPSEAVADGKEFLQQCEMSLAYLEGDNMAGFANVNIDDYMTCPGYIEGIIDLNYQYQGILGKNALFCLPPKKMDKKEGMRIVIEYVRNNSELLKEEKDYIVTSAFSTKYPCIPLMKKKK